MTDDLAAGAAPGRRSWLSGRALGIDIFAVMTSGAATGLLGFAFWTLAARGYSTAEVGRASAMISSVMSCAAVSISVWNRAWGYRS